MFRRGFVACFEYPREHLTLMTPKEKPAPVPSDPGYQRSPPISCTETRLFSLPNCGGLTPHKPSALPKFKPELFSSFSLT